MAKIYIEKWEVWSTTTSKLLKYDTDNLRQSFREMKDWDDEKIKEYLEENDGDIEFNDANDQSGEWWEVSEAWGACDVVEENEHQWDEPSSQGCQVFTDKTHDDWLSKAWWRGSNDLRCEDRSKDYGEIIDHFLNTMKTYEFESWEDEEDEEETIEVEDLTEQDLIDSVVKKKK